MRNSMVSLVDYESKYDTVRFKRENGILQMQLHTDGGEYLNNGISHTELVDAFINIAADHENRVVILTGTGATFGARIDGGSFHRSEETDAARIARVHYEGRRIMQSVLDVEAPMIAAINGPMTRLPPFALTCDITLCSDNATFSDVVHFMEHGTVPGDGVHTVWQYLLGPNWGRYFLLTGQELSAQEALHARVVNEVLPRDQLLPRAWELAARLCEKPNHVLRYSRLVLNQRYRRMILDDVAFGYGMQWLGIKTDPTPRFS
jgi:enoyl-CoA hydratase/carnithine racemase